ncbi:MAG: hypothetical protein IH877_08020 [Gemmatimonadetes bacterium]|nr:hypothetical protein [Gemmatimonadota bacterium]MCZ6760903.1 hypothetical protein [Gemmatimonadota bacterium]
MVRSAGSSGQLAFPSIEDAVGHLVPEVEGLLRRVTGSEPHVVASDESGIKISSPLGFPDGIGSGAVVVELFRYRDGVRLDVRVEHNRFFAKADGSPSDRPCFLNDYVGTVTIEPSTESLPQEFVRQTVAGLSATREAVRRHNRQARGPWEEIRVAANDYSY